jgi:hypothetical protein
MLGLTEKELIKYFSPHIEAAAEKWNTTTEDIIKRIEHYYDGYSFDGDTMLYNPFSVLNFFDGGYNFDNFWMDSGNQAMITNYLKRRQLTVEQFHGVQVSRDFVKTPGEMDISPPEGFLFQGGYLTLRPGTVNDFSLDYPNKETLDSMSQLLAKNIVPEL